MPLRNYGLLTGHVLDLIPQQAHNPHFLLKVAAGNMVYNVSLNVASTPALRGALPPALQFQFVEDLSKAKFPAARKLASAITNSRSFLLAALNPALPRLDYVRGGILDITAFATLPTCASNAPNAYLQKLGAAVTQAKNDSHSFVAVFGSGYAAAPESSSSAAFDPLNAAFGFSGVDNVHMNQGSDYRVGRHLNNQFRENGPNQDGALLFFLGNKTVQGFFCKFRSQDIETDSQGNPTHTGVPELDNPAARKKLQKILVHPRQQAIASETLASVRQSSKGIHAVATAARAKVKGKGARHGRGAGSASAGAAGGSPALPPPDGSVPSPTGFVFNDPAPTDPNRTFLPDDDSAVRNSPFVQNFAVHGVPEPVPGPRDGMYPKLSLDQVLGDPAVSAIQKSNQIVFHAVGDTGAPALNKLPNETAVSDLMTSDLKSASGAEVPQFLFHLGDVVYFYGEQQYYYDQFYKPFKDYPAPIFAVPGNHDGITYNANMASLAGFIEAFVDTQPSHAKEAGGIARTTMIQPGVYFTLDAPFVSIIGLYSNCSESYGYLDAAQKLFLHNELVRLKPMRDSGEILCVIVAVHHPPLSFSTTKPSSTELRDSIDAASAAAGLYPDAVLSGHAHIYQRITRPMTVGGKAVQVPYIIAGAGGYAVNPTAEIDKNDVKLEDVSDPKFRLHRFLPNFGYLKLTVASKAANQAAYSAATKAGKQGNAGPVTKINVPTLRVEFRSTDPRLASPADACVLDLENRQLL